MLSLGKLHQIGELTAAVAVVFSLIFVGYEVRQNSQAQIQSATLEVLRDHTNAARLFSEDLEIACIYLRGNQDFEGLDDIDRFRYSSHLFGYFRTTEQMHSLMLQGSIDLDLWRSTDTIFQELLQRPGLRQWYASRRGWFTDDFRAYLDDAVSQPASGDSIRYEPDRCSGDNV